MAVAKLVGIKLTFFFYPIEFKIFFYLIPAVEVNVPLSPLKNQKNGATQSNFLSTL